MDAGLTLVDQVRFGVGHSAWALRRLLEEAGRLTPEQVRRDLGVGPGSLLDNLAHTIEAMFFFGDCFAGRAYVVRAGFAERAGSMDGLRGLVDEAERELLTSMEGAGGGWRSSTERVAWASSDAGSLSVCAAVAQVFDHAAAHRAQCVNMLKRLGVSPLPDLDPMSYEAAQSAGAGGGRA